MLCTHEADGSTPFTSTSRSPVPVDRRRPTDRDIDVAFSADGFRVTKADSQGLTGSVL